MENLDVFSLKLFFFILTPLREARESIYSPICLALTIINPKMMSGELLGPTDLSGAQALCIYESTEVIMVGKHQNFVLIAFQIVFPGLKSLNNC